MSFSCFVPPSHFIRSTQCLFSDVETMASNLFSTINNNVINRSLNDQIAALTLKFEGVPLIKTVPDIRSKFFLLRSKCLTFNYKSIVIRLI